MASRSTAFVGFKWPVDVIRRVSERFNSVVSEPAEAHVLTLSVERSGDHRTFDTMAEFFEEYRGDIDKATYIRIEPKSEALLSMTYMPAPGLPISPITVTFPDRARLQEVYEVAAEYAEPLQAAFMTEYIRKDKDVVVFVGHGQSGAWREIRDYLQDKLDLQVETYEKAPRAGRSRVDVLSELVDTCNFALLVHTAEDEQADGELRARENVIHETGLFQGRYGFRRAIIVRESGCTTFSNVDGLDEIRFEPGRIKEAFGEIAATIRREFGESLAKS